MRTADILHHKLTAAFAPDILEITDDSHHHGGHIGHRPDGETHFSVKIVAAAFAGKPRLERQRMVMRVLADELAGSVHALQLDCRDK